MRQRGNPWRANKKEENPQTCDWGRGVFKVGKRLVDKRPKTPEKKHAPGEEEGGGPHVGRSSTKAKNVQLGKKKKVTEEIKKARKPYFTVW